jgi:hypothetical protein
MNFMVHPSREAAKWVPDELLYQICPGRKFYISIFRDTPEPRGSKVGVMDVTSSMS